MENIVDLQYNAAACSSNEKILYSKGLNPTLSAQAVAFNRLFELNEANCPLEYGVPITQIEDATDKILARTDLHPLKDLVYRYRKLPDPVIRELDRRIVSIMTNLDSFGDIITLKRMELKRKIEERQKRNTLIQCTIGAILAIAIGIVIIITYI
jgi:hypothetical protein